MARHQGVAFLLVSIVSTCLGQWPLGESFYAQMNQMQRNLDRMVANMQTNMQSMQLNMDLKMQAMNDRMARQRQYILENGNRNVFSTRNYGTGGKAFTTADDGTGYVYNSPDGSVNMFSYSSGPQQSGSIYHSGPDGTYFRSW